MVKRQNNNSPVMGGVRKRRLRQPTMNQNGGNTILKYSSIGSSVTTDVNGNAQPNRKYIPGFSADLVNSVGPDVAAYYSTAKFLPGTHARWEPSVSFTTTGRVFVGFTDNPEIIEALETLRLTLPANYRDRVKGLENVISFPVWQETEIPFPTKLRRKRFDCNETAANSADVYDRSCQIAMFAAVEGGPAAVTTMGSFWFHDVLDVEGLHPVTT